MYSWYYTYVCRGIARNVAVAVGSREKFFVEATPIINYIILSGVMRMSMPCGGKAIAS